jgi:SAM-dependent methyltransferase
VAHEHQHPHDPGHTDDSPAEHPHQHPHQHPHEHDHHHAPGDRDWAEFGARLQLEGDVAMPLIADAIERIVMAAVQGNARIDRILDVGSGPGVAAVALAGTFPGAEAVAVDASAQLLALVHDRAVAHGVGDRVSTAVADLEQPLGHLGAADVVWASMVLHHVASPVATLRALHEVLRPGGLLAIVEFGTEQSVLPPGFDVGNEGFVERHAAAMRASIEAHLPPGAMNLDWLTLLAEAGFEALERGELVMQVASPIDDRQRCFVLQGLQMSGRLVSERLDARDLATLAEISDPVGPRSVMDRDDLTLDVRRSFFLARRR